MNKFSFLGKRFSFLIFLFLPILVFAIINFKLPFENGVKMALTRGYIGATHVGKDKFAVDFALGGCVSWNKPILAVTSGIIIKSDIGHINGEKNSYGNQIMIEHNDGLVTRYAHLNQVLVSVGDFVEQGQQIGTMGNTGSCEGSACKEYPGTHLHFAMYQKDASGDLQPYKPEPMSGYTNFTAGEWYTSDNELYDPNKKVEQPAEQSQEQEKSWWEKIKDVFSFEDDNVKSENSQELKDVTQNTEVKTDYENKIAEVEEIKTYALAFINSNQTVEVESGEEVNVKVQVKNTGTAIWEKKNISANVVGGLASNTEYYHQTWLTSLRPTLLDQTQLAPGQIGSFSFKINTPDKPGQHIFKIQAVRLDNNFSFIPEGFWNININVVENEKKEIIPETPIISQEAEIPLENNIIKDTVEIIKEVVVKAVDTIKEIFYYGGGGSSQTIIEDSSNDSPPDDVTTTTIEISTSTPEVIEDIVPPEIPVVYLSQTGSTTLFVSWNSPDASNYDIEYRTEQEDWQNVVTSTTSTDYQFDGERLQSYYFRVRAYDEAGNVSDWSDEEKLILDWSKSVVINEIAWMGTGPGINREFDEWIELYNNTDSEMDLSNWQILIDNKVLKISKIINPIIPAKGYFILERTDDKAISDVTANMFFSETINDTKGRIILKNDLSETVDEIDCSGGWFAGSTLNNQYRSMMRVDSTLPGSWSNNWQTTLGVDPIARSAGGGDIFGSPKHSNQGNWLLKNLNTNYSEQFDENNVWVLKVENSPYIFDYTEIPVGYTLQIDPGVLLYGKGRSSHIKVSGSLEINGEENNPIVFTSALDNNYVENNLSSLSGDLRSGDWSKIEIFPGGNLIAKHAKFFYGGSKFFIAGGFVFGGKYVSRVINNSGGTVNLDNVEFKNNYIDIDSDYSNYSAVVWSEVQVGGSASTTVSNSYFEGGLVAIKDMHNINSSGRLYQKINNNIFSNFISEAGAVQLGGGQAEIGFNTFLNGTSNILSRDNWSLEKDETLSSGMEYYFEAINVPEGITLFIDPGVKIKMRGGGITINGSLEAMGTSDNPISISNQAGYYWNSLKFINSTSSLNFVQISRGGYLPVGTVSMVVGENSNLDFDHVDLFNPASNYNILYLKNSTTSLSNSNIFRDSFGKDSKGIKLDGGSLILSNTNFNGMNIGVELSGEVYLEMQSMSEDNFQNILVSKWWPNSAWSFVSST